MDGGVPVVVLLHEVRARFDQAFHHLAMPRPGGKVQRCVVLIVLRIYIGASRQQPINDIKFAPVRRLVEHGALRLVYGIEVAARFNQEG